MKKILSIMITAALLTASLAGCGTADSSPQGSSEKEKIYYENETHIVLSDDGVTVDGETVGTDGSIYISNDVIYYEDKDSYESGNPYGEGTAADKHTAEEAASTTVVNIAQAGIYRLSGKLSQGQIRVDLGEEAYSDETAVVTLVLDGVDINCDVAPAVIFMNVYECDGDWSAETAASDVDTSKAGANVIVADGSTNNVEGAYVAKIFKDNDEEKKLWKQDGAFYSYMSMNINGETDGSGVLNITADNEGLDTELHLTINGGNINIFADNDGINTNEDGVSVTTINGGNIHIIAGLGAEGDGVDSNGWLVINGGTVISAANPMADAGLDSDMGSYVNGGTVVALGSTMDWAESDSEQVTMNLQFADYKESDSAIIVTKEDGSVVFAYDPSEDEVVGSNIRRFMGAVISSPDFALEESYNVYVGGTVKGSETAGVYDVSTVKGFENAVQQGYTGSDIMMGPGGFGGFAQNFGGNFEGNFEGNFNGNFEGNFDGNFEGMPQGQMPQFSQGEGFDPEKMQPEFNAGQMGEMPKDKNGNPIGFGGEGNFDFDMSEMPEGMDFINGGENPFGEIPDRGTMPWGGNNGGTNDSAQPMEVFYMQDKVNNFSGVKDFTV